MKLVHAADLHLDSPLRGLARYEGAPVSEIRGATRRALVGLVDLCLDEGASLLLLAGDLYDGDWRDYSTGLFFAAEMARLREGDVRVVLVRGNHDAASRIAATLPLPENVTELGTRRPETWVDEALGLAVHGQGYARRAVTEDLAASYPDKRKGLLNIGLLHTNLDGRPGHDDYAPSAVPVLAGKGYDYWALGHVHTREVVSSDPWIVFPGNVQGRHARECGPKGATVLTLEDGHVADVAHCSLDVVRWAALDVSAEGCADGDDVVDAVRRALEEASAAAEGRLLAARVTITGASDAHRELTDDSEHWLHSVRAVAMDVAGGGVWIEKVRLATSPELDLAALRGRDDAIGQLARALTDLQADKADLAPLVAELVELDRKLPHELRDGPDGLRLDDPQLLRTALADVERLLLPRLVEQTGD